MLGAQSQNSIIKPKTFLITFKYLTAQYKYRCSGIWVNVLNSMGFGIAPIRHGKKHRDGEKLWLDAELTDEHPDVLVHARDTTRNVSCRSSDGTRSVPRSSSAWLSRRQENTAA